MESRESFVRQIVDLYIEAGKYYDSVIKNERKESGGSELAIALLDKTIDVKELAIQYVLDKLKESEDKRIRKELICFLETEIPQCNARDKYITWLEKQGNKDEEISILRDQIEALHAAIIAIGEQITVDEIAKEICRDNVSAVAFLKSAGIMNEKGELAEQYRQDEQKPDTDFSDLRTWKYIIDAVRTEMDGIGQYLDSPFTEEVAKKLQKRFGNIEQKPEQKQEWSEEDEKQACEILELLEESKKNYIYIGGIENNIRWFKERLKSLRPQNT